MKAATVPLEDVRDISKLAYGFMALKALFVALEIDVFGSLAAGPKKLSGDPQRNWNCGIAAAHHAVRAAGAKLFFLPPYSPEPEPDRAGLRQLKTLLRKAAERTVEAAWQRIGALLACFTPNASTHQVQGNKSGSVQLDAVSQQRCGA
jgi:hypothetical protein